jgi:O-antigen ligase
MVRTLQNFAEKAAFFFLILFGVLLPYDMLFATVAVYPFLFFSLLSFRKEKIINIPKFWWLFTIIFLLNVVGYFYTSDTIKASYLLERQLLIFVFPLILPIANQINDRRNTLVLIAFTISCICSLLFLLYPHFIFLQQNHWAFKEIIHSQYFNHYFTKPLGIHATYLSLYVALCVVFLLDSIPRISFLKRMPLLISLLVLIIGLYFMASRNTMLALLLVGLVVYPIFRLRNKIIYFLATIAVLAGFVFISKSDNYIFNRFSIDLVDDLKLDNKYTIENPEPRIMRWKCAWDLIKQKPLFGYGAGDEIPLLLEAYKKNNMMVSVKEEFNTHNQFLSILIKNGIIGLIAFLAMLIYFFRLAINQKDFIYFSFLTIITIGLFTENIIDANKGIFFFAFFNTLLGYNCLNILKQKQKAEAEM